MSLDSIMHNALSECYCLLHGSYECLGDDPQACTQQVQQRLAFCGRCLVQASISSTKEGGVGSLVHRLCQVLW